MSTDSNVFDLLARVCAPANARLPRPEPETHVYSAVLIRDDVSLGELVRALRFSGIVISTDPASGQTVIHRSPKDAA